MSTHGFLPEVSQAPNGSFDSNGAFFFQHSTFVLGEVCRLDPSGFSRPDRCQPCRPVFFLFSGLPVGASAVFKFLFALLWVSLLLILCRFLWFYAAFLSLFLFEASLIGSSCLDLHHASYRPRSSFLTASLVMYRLYSGSLTLRIRFSAPF